MFSVQTLLLVAAVASSSGQPPSVSSGSVLPGHMVGHAGPNHSRAIEFEAAMKAQQLIDRLTSLDSLKSIFFLQTRAVTRTIGVAFILSI